MVADAAGSALGAALVPASTECTIENSMTETAAPLDQQLEEIGAQLSWVRDYL
jgi:hypothetical protein